MTFEGSIMTNLGEKGQELWSEGKTLSVDGASIAAGVLGLRVRPICTPAFNEFRGSRPMWDDFFNETGLSWRIDNTCYDNPLSILFSPLFNHVVKLLPCLTWPGFV